MEAVTGEGSLKHFRADHQIVDVASHFLGAPQADAAPAESFKRALQRKDEELKKLRRELEQARMKSASRVSLRRNRSSERSAGHQSASPARRQRRPQPDAHASRQPAQQARLRHSRARYRIDKEGEKSVALIVGVTKDLTAKIQAGKIVGAIAQNVGG